MPPSRGDNVTKWGKVENNYGGGNQGRQAHRTEPKYCFMEDGLLNLAFLSVSPLHKRREDPALFIGPDQDAETGRLEIRAL
jgi:hypothetical protein